MFVLQDCSICFEDYGAVLAPHTIPCGHVFCRPCLDSLVSSNSGCPHCRAPFDGSGIRKVVCSYQDPHALDTPSEAERVMWQAISSVAESTEDYEQRKLLVRNNPRQATREAGFSGNLHIALDLMRLLVEVESTKIGFKYNMETSRAFEASLRERVSFLEGQLSESRTRPNSQNIQTLLSDMQELKSSVRIIDQTTSRIARQQSPAFPLPLVPTTRASRPSAHTRTASSPAQTRYPPQPNPVPRSTPSTESRSPRTTSTAATPVQGTNPATPTTTRPFHLSDIPRTSNSLRPSSTPAPQHGGIESPPEPSQQESTFLRGLRALLAAQPSSPRAQPSSSRTRRYSSSSSSSSS